MVTPTSETVVAYPSAALTRYVDQYLGYRMVGFPPGLHRGVPSRHLTFIVSIGAPIDVVEQTDPSQPAASYRCAFGGLQASPAWISHSGDQEGVSIDLTPLGCRTLFGIPAAAVWNTTVELDDVARRFGDELWERLQGTQGWAERFAVCNEVLERLAARHERVVVPDDLSRAWHLLDASNGAIPVGGLAAEMGWSRQHLRRRFADEFGLSPKLAGRVIRFDRARLAMQAASSTTSIATIAAEHGYYDQAHLAREFAELAHCSPTEFLAGDVPSVQDREGGAHRG